MSNEEISVFRPKYRELNNAEKELVNLIKSKAEELYYLMPKKDGRGANREIVLAMDALEESVMWAVKGITGEQLPQFRDNG